MGALAFAWTLGGAGAHKFYLGQAGVGFLYLLFCWTFIPAFIALLEGFSYLSMTDQQFAAHHRGDVAPTLKQINASPSWMSCLTERFGTSRVIGVAAAVVIILAMIGKAVDPSKARPSRRSDNVTSSTPIPGSAASTSNSQLPWYEGGTLLEQGALEWQNATYENKLATCADMVSSAWMAKALKPELQGELDSMDDLRVLADELVDFIDAFARREPDSHLNSTMYTNQSVRDMGALGVMSMGWAK